MVPLVEEAMVSTLSSAMGGMIRRPAPGVKRWICDERARPGRSE
jgi:hypothetical protein